MSVCWCASVCGGVSVYVCVGGEGVCRRVYVCVWGGGGADGGFCLSVRLCVINYLCASKWMCASVRAFVCV